MTKEKEMSFIKKEMETLVTTLEKKDTFNNQVIEELDKLLNIAKYGSVGHVNKVVRLSTLRNYKLRLAEVVEAVKQITDLQSIETLEGYIANVITDSKSNMKSSSDSLNTVEVFTNEYIKNEILVKTYSELSALYTDVESLLKKVKEDLAASVVPAEETQPAPLAPKKESTKKETA